MPAPVWIPGGMPSVCTVLSGYARVWRLPDVQTVCCEIRNAADAVVSSWQHTLEPTDGNGVSWLSAAADPATDDVFLYANQHARGANRGYIVTESGGPVELTEQPLGARSGKLQWEGADLVLYMTATLTTYWRWVDPLGSAAPATTAIGFNSGGQGMRYVSGTTPQWFVTAAGVPASITIQGVRFVIPVTRAGLTIGQAGDFGDTGVLSINGNAVVVRIFPTKTFDQYDVVPFGDGSGLFAATARTETTGGGNAAFIVGPPWVGTVLASGDPFVIPGGGPIAGGPTTNAFRTVTRPALPKSIPPKTYPHVAEIAIKGKVDEKAPVPRVVRDALAASQQSVRLIWDQLGALGLHRDADLEELALLRGQMDLLKSDVQSVRQTALEALTAAGKPTRRPVAAPSGPQPPLDPVGGPGTPTPPGGGAVVVPGTSDAFDAREVEWQGPVDPSGWTIGATITNVQITPTQICLDYTGKNAWPAVDPSGDGVLSPGNPWVIAEIAGTKYGSTYEWLRVGQICKNVTGPEFQDYVLGSSPLSSWTPALGEIVWFMVSSLARSGPQSPMNQRTQIVAVTWPF